jgi:hypothetical protein
MEYSKLLRKLLQKQEHDSYGDGIFKLMPIWEKSITVPGYILQNYDRSVA